jgi:hypothetical protein
MKVDRLVPKAMPDPSQRVGDNAFRLRCVPGWKPSRASVTDEAVGSDVALVSLGVSGLEWVLA